jgi:hypothetical protein
MILYLFFDDGDWDRYINRRKTFWGLLGTLWLIEIDMPRFMCSPRGGGGYMPRFMILLIPNSLAEWDIKKHSHLLKQSFIFQLSIVFLHSSYFAWKKKTQISRKVTNQLRIIFFVL